MTKSCFLFFLRIAVLTLFSLRLFASPQMPDYIIYKNDTIVTYNLLVEKYLQSNERIHPNKLFGLSYRDSTSLYCWRGYQAIYKIDNDSLFLVDMIHCGERRMGEIDTVASALKMKAIFGDKVVNGKVYIDWFSGDISIPLNFKKLRWDGIFHTIYERETVFNIAGGKIIHVADVNNYEHVPHAIDRKDKSKLSGILFKQLKKVKWKNTYCSNEYLVTIDKEGKVSKVTMPRYPTQDSIDKYYDREDYDYCINNMLKALQKLKFDIIKDRGKLISEDVYLEIWFDSKRRIKNWTN